MASFVAMGGDLERGCFNVTISPGYQPGWSPGPLAAGSRAAGPAPAGTA